MITFDCVICKKEVKDEWGNNPYPVWGNIPYPVEMVDDLDDIRKYQIAVVKQGIKALQRGMKLNSAYTSTACRNFVTRMTGIKYPAGKKGLEKALGDIDAIIHMIGLNK